MSRARLGGIPIGVIGVETRTVQKVIPADPASDSSREQVIHQAGQVWYPDSAFKTATAINDFNNGEELPLIIFANWRGFSGGVADMYREILKFGSMIVDALASYRQPVFVYIPPEGELRGGAWAVLDPTVNPHGRMEMFCSERGRGGILEPTGTAQVKLKPAVQHALMQRLDNRVKDISIQLNEALERRKQHDCSHAEQVSLDLTIMAQQKELNERRSALKRLYHQIGLHFCDAHDTPERMVAKDVISAIVPWAQSRQFFYYRLKRRVLELQRAKETGVSLESLMTLYNGDVASDTDVVTFLEDEETLIEFAKKTVNQQKTDALIESVKAAILDNMDDSVRQQLLDALAKK